MKPAFLFLLALLVSTIAYAQKYQVTESELEIKGVPRKGQHILIQLDSKEVERAWENHLREKAGKIVMPIALPKHQLGKGIAVLEKARIDTISKTPMRIISKVEATETGTALWWTLDLGSAYVSQQATPREYAAAESFLQHFARKAYRDDMQRQVAEAEKVLHSSQNEQSRVMRQAEDLKKSLDRNAQRKLDLEAELARNAKERVALQTEVENNLKQQEAARAQVENLQKAVEVVKAKAQSL